MSKNTEIATTILQQLGGGRFRAMTGAKDMFAVTKGLQFKLPGKNFAKDGINLVEITLNAADTYDCKYMRMWGGKVKVVKEDTGIYADMLQNRFREITGLDTSL